MRVFDVNCIRIGLRVVLSRVRHTRLPGDLSIACIALVDRLVGVIEERLPITQQPVGGRALDSRARLRQPALVVLVLIEALKGRLRRVATDGATGGRRHGRAERGDAGATVTSNLLSLRSRSWSGHHATFLLDASKALFERLLFNE